MYKFFLFFVLYIHLSGKVTIRAIHQHQNLQVVIPRNKNAIHKEGYCSVEFENGNFIENNVPAPKITGETYALLKETCPYLSAKGPTSTHACCNAEAIEAIRKGVEKSRFFSECPSCLRNIYNIWCDMYCSPNQSIFVQKNQFTLFNVSNELINGLYNSCRDVSFPKAFSKLISLVCDSDIGKCTPASFIERFGPSNGFFVINGRMHIPDTGIPDPKVPSVPNMVNNNMKMIGCNKTYFDVNTGQQSTECSCENCRTSCKQTKLYDALAVHIKSTVDLPIDHYRVYQQSGYTNFSGVIHKELFEKVLKLQLSLMKLTGKQNKETITINDVCYKPNAPNNNNCAVYSVLQYWQLNETNLNKCITNFDENCNDPGKFGNDAEDWHDQFLDCTKIPATESSGHYLKLSCWSTFGIPIHPRLLFENYNINNYKSSKSLKLTFLIKRTTKEEQIKANAWEQSVFKYLKQWSIHEAPKQNISITFKVKTKWI